MHEVAIKTLKLDYNEVKTLKKMLELCQDVFVSRNEIMIIEGILEKLEIHNIQ